MNRILPVITVFLALGVLSLATTKAFADPLEDAKSADLAMSKAVLDHDIAAFKAFLLPDAIFLAVPEAGPEAVAQAWAPFFAEKRLSLLQWQPDRGQVASSGELAFTSGPYDYERTGPDGKIAHFKGRYVTVWQHGEGGWKVLADGSQVEAAEGTFGAQLAAIWPPAGMPDAVVEVERKPIRVVKSKAGDLLVVVGKVELEAGEAKVMGRYLTVSESDGEGGWRLLAEGNSPLTPQG